MKKIFGLCLMLFLGAGLFACDSVTTDLSGIIEELHNHTESLEEQNKLLQEQIELARNGFNNYVLYLELQPGQIIHADDNNNNNIVHRPEIEEEKEYFGVRPKHLYVYFGGTTIRFVVYNADKTMCFTRRLIGGFHIAHPSCRTV